MHIRMLRAALIYVRKLYWPLRRIKPIYSSFCVCVCVFCDCVTLQTIPVSDVFLTDLVLRIQVLLRLCDGASSLTGCWAKPNPSCTSPLSPLLSCGRKSSQSLPMWSKWLGSRSGHCQQAPEVFVDVCVCVCISVCGVCVQQYVCVCV